MSFDTVNFGAAIESRSIAEYNQGEAVVWLQSVCQEGQTSTQKNEKLGLESILLGVDTTLMSVNLFCQFCFKSDYCFSFEHTRGTVKRHKPDTARYALLLWTPYCVTNDKVTLVECLAGHLQLEIYWR